MKYYLPLLAVCLFLIPGAAMAFDNPSSDVNVVVLDSEGAVTTSFYPFGESYRGTASLASGDLGTDGVPEIIVGAGPGLEPSIKIYRQDGSLISEFLAYDEGYRSGTTVAVCDLEGDGESEIITGTQLGGGPHVRIFNAEGEALYEGGFFAYADDFRGGVNVACGDVDGDGLSEIVTGAGVTGGPHIRVFAPDGSLKYEVFSGSASENTGATVALGDIDGNGDQEIIAGRMGVGDPTVIIFNIMRNRLAFMGSLPGFQDYRNGLQVTSGDVDGDGADEIGLATSRHSAGLINFYELTGATTKSIQPFHDELERGVIATTVSGETQDLIVAASSSPRTNDQVGKYILVDLSEQTLYAYENGALVNSFLVSTGVWYFPTPTGKSQVYEKLLWHDYQWNYGEGNPNNYYIPDVKYNLRIRDHIYIHYAYWHNNFGHRMSHGCVNTGYDDSEWIYNWAEVGTPAEIVE